MTWLFENAHVEALPEDCVGFVYLITNLITGRKYIGKKLAKFSKTTYKVVKLKNGNKKRKKIRSKIDSDWQTYYGSSDFLKAEIAEQGVDNYSRTILQFCSSKSEMSYVETKEQFVRDVLLSDEYYNSWITCKIHKAHVYNKI